MENLEQKVKDQTELINKLIGMYENALIELIFSRFMYSSDEYWMKKTLIETIISNFRAIKIR